MVLSTYSHACFQMNQCTAIRATFSIHSIDFCNEDHFQLKIGSKSNTQEEVCQRFTHLELYMQYCLSLSLSFFFLFYIKTLRKMPAGWRETRILKDSGKSRCLLHCMFFTAEKHLKIKCLRKQGYLKLTYHF